MIEAASEPSPYKRLTGLLNNALTTTALAFGMVAAPARGVMAQTNVPSPRADTGAFDTCYAGQVSGPYAQRIAEATVMVVLRDKDGHPFGIGSGFMVHGSGSPDNPHKRLLTAAHVVLPIPEKGWIEITASDGSKVGRADIAATGTGYNDKLRHNDLAVLAIASFNPGEEAKYDAATGLPLGPQYTGGHISGLISAPAGISSGNSGGPVINEDGAVIGVVQAGLAEEGTVTVNAPRIQSPFLPGTHTPNNVPRTMDKPGRMYATTIMDGAISAALGEAGRTAPQVATLPGTPVTISGVPDAGCIISTGTVKALDINSLEDFKVTLPEQVPEELRFQHWNDPRRAATELKSLLNDTQKILPEDSGLAAMRKTLEPEQDMGKINLTDLPKALFGWFQAVNQKDDGTNNQALIGRLLDATYNVDAWIHRADLGMQPESLPPRPAAVAPPQRKF